MFCFCNSFIWIFRFGFFFCFHFWFLFVICFFIWFPCWAFAFRLRGFSIYFHQMFASFIEFQFVVVVLFLLFFFFSISVLMSVFRYSTFILLFSYLMEPKAGNKNTQKHGRHFCWYPCKCLFNVYRCETLCVRLCLRECLGPLMFFYLIWYNLFILLFFLFYFLFLLLLCSSSCHFCLLSNGLQRQHVFDVVYFVVCVYVCVCASLAPSMPCRCENNTSERQSF